MMKDKIILDGVYNLIQNQDITPDERDVLVRFKNSLTTNQSNLSQQIASLVFDTQQLAVKNIGTGKRLSPPMAEFYSTIKDYKEVEKNVARGLVSFGFMI